MGGNKFATRMAWQGARALFCGIYKKSTSRKREGFGDSGTGILFCLWCVAFHA
ncbi:hypothetical protein CCF61_005363, partial [Salmonella enterica subsp. enterica serovar Glostrup]|nr:hypothetical protein [Salmonella enterica subsp. enterica serovar Glostrup]